MIVEAWMYTSEVVLSDLPSLKQRDRARLVLAEGGVGFHCAALAP